MHSLLLFLLCLLSVALGSITNLEATLLSSGSISTESKYVNLTFIVKNAPFDGSLHTFIKLPVGYISRPGVGLVGKICAYNEATGACSTAFGNAQSLCFFENTVSPDLISNVNGCNGNVMNLGTDSSASYPTTQAIVAVLPPAGTFKYEINFLIPPAYPTAEGAATPTASVFVGDITNSGVTTESNIVSVETSRITPGSDLDTAGWYIRTLSDSNYIFTSSAYNVGSYVAYIDMQVNASSTFALKTNLYAGDTLVMELPNAMVIKGAACFQFYRTNVNVSGGAEADATFSLTANTNRIAFSLPKGLRAQRSNTDAQRIICSGGSFKYVPTLTELIAKFYLASADQTPKSVPVSVHIGNPATPLLQISPMAITLDMTGTSIILETATAQYVIAVPVENLDKGRIVMSLPANVGWTPSTTCTIKYGSSSVEVATTVTLISADLVHIDCDQALKVTNTLRCILTPPYYAQNNIVGTGIRVVSLDRVGNPIIAAGTFTWVAAKAGTFVTGTFQLTKPYMGDVADNAVLLLRVPTHPIRATNQIRFTFHSQILVNSGGPTVCTLRDPNVSIPVTYVLSPSLSVDNPHVLVITILNNVTFPIAYIQATCTHIQSPATPLTPYTNVALLTNSDGRVIMSKDVTTNAGLMPNFGSNVAVVEAVPPHTGNIVTVKISLKPVLSGISFNWNFRPPTNWIPASVSVTNTCKAVFNGNAYTLTYSTAGSEFRVNTTPLRLVVATLEQVDLYCDGFTTPFITTPAASMSMNFLTDAWVAPSTSPAISNVQWPLISPAITSFKTVILDKPIVDTMTDLTFTLQIAHTKQYSLNGVIKFIFPEKWFLSSTAQEYVYTQNGTEWVETLVNVGGPTVCSVFQGSNNLAITNTVIDTTSAQHSVALTIGSSSHLANGDIIVQCSNLKTFRGSVNTHTVKYEYRNSANTLIEETLILLPFLNTGKLGFVYGNATHTNLKPKQTGTFTASFKGLEHALLVNEKVCIDAPMDFIVPVTGALQYAYYTDRDVSSLADAAGMTVSMAHASLSVSPPVSHMLSSVAANVTYVLSGGVAKCTISRNGVTLSSTAYAQRNTTTEIGTGNIDMYTQLCITLTNAAQLLPNGMEDIIMTCDDVVTHPYAHAARSDVQVYSVTSAGDKLDLSKTITFPEVLPGDLLVSTFGHTPSLAGKTGDLTAVVTSLTNGMTVNGKFVVRLPLDWTVPAEGCTATIAGNAASACEATIEDGYRIIRITNAVALPDGASATIVVNNVKAPAYADGAKQVHVWTETQRGNTVDKTTSATLNEVLPGVLGKDVSTVLMSTIEPNSVANMTMLFYPLPNSIPVGGGFTTTFPASPSFPAVHTSFGCEAQVYYDPNVVSIIGGRVVSGQEVYNYPTTVTGTVTFNPTTRTMRFNPSTEIPADRLLHIQCSFFINSAAPNYQNVSFTAETVDNMGRLVSRADKLSIDSGYPATLHFSTHPPVAALVNIPFTHSPVIAGTDIFGKPATGPAYVYIGLVLNDNDPTALLWGNLTGLLQASESVFNGLYVDKVGYGYQLSAWCFGVKTANPSNLFSVWEGSESSKFFWSQFPYIEVLNADINASLYVRKAGSMEVDPAVAVDVDVRLFNAQGVDVSHLLVGGKAVVHTVDGVANVNLQVTQPGEYYLEAFSTSGYFLPGKTPVFTIVNSNKEKEDTLLREDEEQLRVTIGLQNTHEVSPLSTLETLLRTKACEALPYYFPKASASALCGRISTVDITSTTWIVDISESNPSGTRPTANEIAVVLEQLLTDESSIWNMGSPSAKHYTTTMTKSKKSSNDESWIALGAVAGSLGFGVVSIAGTTVYRLYAMV